MALPAFLKEFTKPFLKNDILSVDIGYTNIKVVQARKKGPGSLKVLNYCIEKTPSGCIRNGIISNLEGIADNLGKVVANHGISERNVKIVVSAGSNILSKVVFISKNGPGSLEERIREEVCSNMPVDMGDMKLFYRTIEGGSQEREAVIKVLVTVVPNSVIENYMKLVRLLRFNPVAIEIPFSSVARFFSKGIAVAEGGRYIPFRPVTAEKGATAVIDLGSETTNLSVLNDGTLEFNRIVLAGGKNLDEVVAKSLDIGKEAAKLYKENYGITAPPGISSEVEEAVGMCIREYLGEILGNIRRSLDFYVDRCGGQSIERAFFIGGGSGLKGLKAFAEEALGIPVYTIDMVEVKGLEFEENLNREKIRYLVNALGIAM